MDRDKTPPVCEILNPLELNYIGGMKGARLTSTGVFLFISFKNLAKI